MLNFQFKDQLKLHNSRVKIVSLARECVNQRSSFVPRPTVSFERVFQMFFGPLHLFLKHADPARLDASGVAFINALLWLVAAGIIGSIVYLSALERQREFAVFKATGASNRSLLFGLALQAVVLSAAAAVLAVGIARLLAPGFPFTIEIPPQAFPRLLGVAVLVGLVASAAGLRRAVGVQPALAFGGP